MGGEDSFSVRISGKGAHAAMPHHSVDVIVAASAIVGSLQSVVARTIDPLDSAVLSVTQLHAGSAMNVLPEVAEINGTIRYLKPDVREVVICNLERIVEHTSRAHGASATVDVFPGYPPTRNDTLSTERARAAALDIFSSEKYNYGRTAYSWCGGFFIHA